MKSRVSTLSHVVHFTLGEPPTSTVQREISVTTRLTGTQAYLRSQPSRNDGVALLHRLVDGGTRRLGTAWHPWLLAVGMRLSLGREGGSSLESCEGSEL